MVSQSTRVLLAAFCSIAALSPLQAFGQESPSWVGQRVITRFGTVLTVDGRVVDDEGRGKNHSANGRELRAFRFYRVERESLPWLWLAAEGESVAGWVQVGDVIRFDQAVAYFTEQIRENPTAMWYTRRGVIRTDLKQYDLAISDYTQAIQLDPTSPVAYNDRGLALAAKGQTDKAIADYDQAVKLEPDYALAFNNRGVARHAKGQFDQAIADFDKAIGIDPRFRNAYYNRALAWDAKSDFDKGIADYTQAIRIDPKYALAYYNRGNTWQLKKRPDQAITDYDHAIRINPLFSKAYLNRGIARTFKGQYSKAIADLRQVIRLDPLDPNPYNDRAWIWATCPDPKLRDGKRAVESAMKACELTKFQDANCLGTLAAAYAEAGDFEKAVECQEKAVKLYGEKEKKDGEERLNLYKAKQPFHQQPKA